ncbi:MAG: ABC transporter permease [Trueperaceae bacterium]|nr:ABC transporter permease [Trueperaceae bacterium]
MRPVYVGRIAAKEILSTLRDTRAIVSNLVIPLVLLPVMMLGLPLLLGGLFERETTTVTELAVEGLAELPDELVALAEAQNAVLIDVPDALAAVREGTYSAGLIAPAGFAEALTEGRAAEVTIVAKTGNLRGELNGGKLRGAVDAYTQSLVADRLREAGLDPAVLRPIAVASADASTEAERSSGQLAWLIPFFIAIWTLTGGQMTAIDATAGEKERGTLEVLLVAPVRRTEVVFGKFLAVMTFGLSAAVMAIVGFVLGGTVLRRIFLPLIGGEGGEMASMMGGTLTITPATIGLLLVSALLLAAVVAALLLTVTLFARSFKEAQTYVAPMSFVLLVPAIALQFRELIGTGDAAYWIPVYNAMVLMDDVVKGSATASAIGITWLVMAAMVALLLVLANASFRREDVLFRT